MNTFSRKNFIAFIISCLVLVSLAACGTDKGDTAAPSVKPTTSEPTNSAQPTVSVQPTEDSKVEWDKIVEAAKKEGEVVVFGQPTTDREEVVNLFSKEYPDIKVKYTGMRPSASSPKILAEQGQGKYLVDVYLEVPPNYPTADSVAMVRDYIVRPELKDDKTWVDGYERGYELTSNANVYPFAVQIIPSIHVNNDVIPEGEIKNFDDLLDPKWKGKIIIGSFDVTAQGSGTMSGLLMSKGEEFVKKVVEDQQAQIKIFDNRQLLTEFATGKYPISIGPTTLQVQEFVDKGVVKKVTKVEEEISTAVNPANVSVLKNPPHPNATKVFLDWFLSKDAQTAWVTKTDGFISRRTDVQNPNPDIITWDKIDAKYSNHSVEGRKSHAWILDYGKKLSTK